MLSKNIFALMLGIMKNQLKLAEFRFGGKESDTYKYYKEQTMNHFYDATKKFYLQGVIDGLFETCECGASLRHGWSQHCQQCAGCGFKDKN